MSLECNRGSLQSKEQEIAASYHSMASKLLPSSDVLLKEHFLSSELDRTHLESTSEKSAILARSTSGGSGYSTPDSAQSTSFDLAFDPLRSLSDLTHLHIGTLSTHAAYLGLTGQLHVDKYSVAKTLRRAGGPLADQLINRMAKLEQTGWIISPVDLNKTDGTYWGRYDRPARVMVFARQRGGMLAHWLGADFAPSGGLRSVAATVAHELGHHDWVKHSALGGSGLHCLATEANAILAQLDVATRLGLKDARTREFTDALKQGRLGSAILQVWQPHYTALKDMSPQCADEFVAEYLRQAYGEQLVCPSTGKILPVDLDAPKSASGRGAEWVRVGNPDTEFSMKQFIEARSRYFAGGASPPLELSPRSSIIGHATKGVFAVAVCAAANDIVSGYRESQKEGTARLVDTAVRWGGYELGSKAVNEAFCQPGFDFGLSRSMLKAGVPRQQVLTRLKVGKVGAFIAGSCLVAELAHQFIGRPAENAIRQGNWL